MESIVRAVTRPDDTVLVWGHAVRIALEAGREMPTRFIFDYPLTVPTHSPLQAAWQDEFVRSLERDPPALVIIATQDSYALERESSKAQVTDIPGFRSFLMQYCTWSKNGAYIALRRAPADACLTSDGFGPAS